VLTFITFLNVKKISTFYIFNVFENFSPTFLHLCVEYYRDLEICVTGHSRSLKMEPFDRPQTTFYWSAIVTIAQPLSCTIFELFDVEQYRDLEIWVRNHSSSFKLVLFENTVSHSHFSNYGRIFSCL